MTLETPASAAAAAVPERPYTAVVVFHGMGQQRHYESVWRLIQALDEFVFRRADVPGAKFIDKRLLLKTRRERLRNETGPVGEEEIVYTEVQHVAVDVAGHARFYEGYWAPATVGGTSALSVLGWLLRQVPRPLQVLAASWRAFARLRRAGLVGLVQGDGAQRRPENRAPDPARVLMQRYDEFCRWRPPAEASFFDFLFYVRNSVRDPAQRQAQLATLWRWWRRHHGALLRSAALLLLAGLAIASLGLLALLGSLAFLRAVSGWGWLAGLFDSVGFALKVEFGTAVSLLAAAAAMFGVSAFLRDAVGDVQQFVTYEEADVLHERRERVLAAARKSLRHVLADPLCERVLVFAHSLGSAVALDTLLALRAHNECAAPRQSGETYMQGPIALHKLEHLVTCGSPIDKIALFFATLRSDVAGFERMVDDLRGDVGDIPFSKAGGQPHMHWVNFWDRGDPISGAIDTVVPALLRRQRVDNVRLASFLWPDVAASHEAYFEHPAVVGHLYDAVFLGGASFAEPPRLPPQGGHTEGRPVYEWLGPGRGSGLQSLLALLLPAGLLLLVAAAACTVLQFHAVPVLQALGVFSAVLLGVAALQRLLRRWLLQRRPRTAP
jgi:hypothetical protein